MIERTTSIKNRMLEIFMVLRLSLAQVQDILNTTTIITKYQRYENNGRRLTPQLSVQS